MKLILSILALLATMPALAAEVIAVSSGRKSIAVSHEQLGSWAVNDRACIVQNGTDVVCGSIIKTSVRGAIVSLDTNFTGVAIGDKVRKAGSGRRLSAETVETFNAHQSPRTFDLTLGLGVGLSFFYPMLHFQVGLGKHFALGVQPLYYKASGGTTSVSAVGGMLTANYYHEPYFRGLWVSLGAGINSISVEDSTLFINEKASSTLGLLTVGWRGRWSTGWNAGIAGGIQYLASPNFTSILLKSEGVQPLLTLDFGINF